MILTKTQLRIMQLFTSRIVESFSIREVERELKIDYSLVHRAIIPLIKQHKLLKKTEHNRIALNFRKNHSILSYAEYNRKDELLKKPANKDLALCLEAFVRRFREDNFTLVLFGSIVNKKKPNDFDVLLVVDSIEKTESAEAFLYSISQEYGIEDKLHIICIAYENVYEMLGTREQKNVMNEVLNKHIIVYGAELFYRLIDKGRR